jgi:hypothetical protein
MKKNLIIGAGIIVALFLVYVFFGRNKAGNVGDILTAVRRGPFKI